MSIVVLLPKHCLQSLNSAWLALKRHMSLSFSQPSYSDNEAKAYGFLGVPVQTIEKCLKLPELKSCDLLLSIEPDAGLAPKISYPCKSLFVQRFSVASLEVFLKLLEQLPKLKNEQIILLVMHLSQIPSKTEGFKGCHEAMLKTAMNRLKMLSLKKAITLIIIDEPELLGNKNSALFERLFLSTF
jgi:hypothetical protein